MKLGPRAKLLLLLSLFALPIVASSIAYLVVEPGRTSNYGELLQPTPAPAQAFVRGGGGRFTFADVAGKWVMVASDSGACGAACQAKLTTMRQVRLALGRNASRVERVLVIDDLHVPAEALAHFEGLTVAIAPPGAGIPVGAGNDRRHIYLVDPRGQVMMRWPAAPEAKRMLRDLDRLLRASQSG